MFGIIVLNIDFFYIFFIRFQGRARLQKCLTSLIIYLNHGLGKSLIDTNRPSIWADQINKGPGYTGIYEERQLHLVLMIFIRLRA